jgi:hypothetical protein
VTDATDPLLNFLDVMGQRGDIRKADQWSTAASPASATQRARAEHASSFREPPLGIALVAKVNPDDVRGVRARGREALSK